MTPAAHRGTTSISLSSDALINVVKGLHEWAKHSTAQSFSIKVRMQASRSMAELSVTRAWRLWVATTYGY